MKIKFLIIAFLIIIITTVSFLFSPRPGPEVLKYNENYIKINRLMGFYVVCDADAFIQYSQSPNLLFSTQKYPQQSRPLYVLAGWLVGKPIQLLIEISGLSGPYFRNLRGYFLGYIFLNFIFLFFSIILFKKICDYYAKGRAYDKLLLYSLLIFLSSNIVTKAFFWTAHTQMLVFFVPLFCLYSILLLKNSSLSFKYIILISFILGILPLFYASFVFCLPSLVYALFICKKNYLRIQNYPKIFACSLVFTIPTLLWIWILQMKNIPYYNHEIVAYRQFVWIFDSIKISPLFFLQKLWSNIIIFIMTFRGILFFIITITILFAILQFYKIKIKGKENISNLLDIIFLIIIISIFFLCMGYYQLRLTFTLEPLLLVLIFILANLIKKNIGVFLFIIAIIWHIINVFSYGPFL